MADLPTLTRICLEAAARIGLEAQQLDSEHGLLLELVKDDVRHLMLGGRSPLNDAVSARIASDKHYSMLLLSRANVRIPETARCLSPRDPNLAFRDRAGIDAGIELAERVGYPVVVRPNQRAAGRGVQLCHDRRRLAGAVREAWDADPIALVQACVEGRDFQLHFLDDAFLIGYERRPLRVRGDGKRTLGALLSEKDPRFSDPARHRRLAEDPRWREMMDERGWTLSSVPKEGASLSFDGSIQNLHGPSTARLVERIPEGLRALCAGIGRTFGLRHYGIDLKIETLESDPKSATVLQVKSSPMLAQLYLLGHREPVIHAQMKVLSALFG